MFLRTKRARGHDYLVLVENHREGGQVRQRTIRYFGRLDRVDVREVRRVLAALPGFAFLAPEEGLHHVVQTGRDENGRAPARGPPAME